ncbi:kinesin-like protein Klp5 [Entomortierella chlamydospora]|uniref:Kinesin-like protein Klp5 n=1 Tax=Entomortierella chlamydospora TaxID=101097 RepID=A0A9P6N397_9FUNG|nr:kinesin-like protein Klp5 [Entomortierella chlamydospora]KAG0022185.1 kinesin-like protein Klp5 [Entomortierella chlamydospora]
MHDLSVLESIHPDAGPTIEASQLVHITPSLTTEQIISIPKLELVSAELTPTQGSSVLANEGIARVNMEEVNARHSEGRMSNDPLGGLEEKAKTLQEMSQWPSESAILVAVRVRPLNPSEQARLPPPPTNRFNFSAEASLSTGFGSSNSRGDRFNHTSGTNGTKSTPSVRRVVDVLDESVLVFDPPDAESISKYKRALLPVQAYRRFKDMRYAFDRVFHENSQQQEVFENTTRHLIDGVLNGYNGTLFAYGATGCGKTHTISGTPQKPGIIFLTMQELYERIKEQEDEKTIEVSLSYLEVYNETIRDLLAKPSSENAKRKPLRLREDSSKRVTIAGLSEHHPNGMDELMELIFMGNENRTVSPTEANATSSRSHAVLQINICQRLKTANISEDFTVATLSLIDLAGSERASATKNRGSRMVEGANINKSLLALGNCINALCENKPKSHIPYRDSKLTRLLKFSLGGNCKTVMIACVSPSSQHYEETHNTLRYANRAKNIKTKVTKNTLNVDRHVSEYVQAIYELRQEVAELKGKLHNQAKSEGMERAQQRQEMLSREYEDMIRKMRATFHSARPQEATYAQLQSQLFIASARLSGLHRWRAGFDEASQAARKQSEKIEQEREQNSDLDELESEAVMRSKKLESSLSASSSYIKIVDDLIDDLNEQIVLLTRQMQEQEDALKMYAISIQSMEQKDNPILESGFPYQRLYELEKKCQALESHNRILTTKLELSDKSLSEQFLATDDFMELSARSLVGLRPEIETIEQAGLPTKTLNDIYMASITSFTDMTKRVGTSVPHDSSLWSSSLSNSASGSLQRPMPSSPFQRDGSVSAVGLNGSRMMSILPEVPQTPVKRQSTSHFLPNLSMDTVDTNLALGSSSLFGSLSPVRMHQDRTQMSSLHNPFQVDPTPGKGDIIHRRKSLPMAGVVFSPKRRRARGGLRQPRLAPTPTKRSVNFLLDIVAEEEDRYTTGLRDPALPLLKPTSHMSISSPPQNERSNPSSSSSSSSSTSITPQSLGNGPTPPVRVGMGGGAKRLVPVNNSNVTGTNSQNGARRVISTSGWSYSGVKLGKGEMSKGPKRIVPISGGPLSSLVSSMTASPIKRPRLPEKGPSERNAKRPRSTSIPRPRPR